MVSNKFQIGFRSLCVKDFISGDPNMPHALPIYATSTFVYESAEKAMRVFEGKDTAFIYGRWHNPTVEAVEKKIAALETFQLNRKAEAVMFSSGMAAISAVLMSLQLKKGDAILTQGNLYGTTTDLMNTVFENIGVEIIYENLKDLNKTASILKEKKNLRLIYIESPANPTCDCYDLKSLSALAKKYKAVSCIDNTFASPYLQQPFKYGIDFIVHSTTKFLNGHGNAIGGVVIGTDKARIKQVWNMRKLMGGNSNPFDAFLLNNGIKTLPLRMDMHCANAMKVAQFLSAHPKVSKVNYIGLPQHPDYKLAKKQMNGFGGMLSFEMKGGFKAALNVLKKIKFLILTASLGTADTLIQHPASMTHVKVSKEQKLKFGITDGLIRMSVGLENIEDILTDLEQAMK
jgi:methionine-gamma-lyase